MWQEWDDTNCDCEEYSCTFWCNGHCPLLQYCHLYQMVLVWLPVGLLDWQELVFPLMISLSFIFKDLISLLISLRKVARLELELGAGWIWDFFFNRGFHNWDVTSFRKEGIQVYFSNEVSRLIFLQRLTRLSRATFSKEEDWSVGVVLEPYMVLSNNLCPNNWRSLTTSNLSILYVWAEVKTSL